MEHISTHTLEVYLTDRDALSAEEIQRITEHLDACALCAEQRKSLAQFYGRMETHLQRGPDSKDKEVADKLLASKVRSLPERGLSPIREALENYAEVIEPYRRGILRRAVELARLYPLRTAGVAALGVAAVVLSVVLGRVSKDTNPTYAVVENFVLRVFNKEGELLWTKQVLGTPNGNTVDGWGPDPQRYAGVEDIDGAGKNVVLARSRNLSSLKEGDSLWCFEGDGRMRWASVAGKSIRFGTQDAAADAQMVFMSFVVCLDRKNNVRRLFAACSAREFFPNNIVELDTKTGKVVGEPYWHAGPFAQLIAADLDGDGRDEIIVGGASNPYGKGFMAVLDPERIGGHGPCTEEYLPTGIPKARERHYLLFPRTELHELISQDAFNPVRLLRYRDPSSLIVYTLEAQQGDAQATVVYTLDAKSLTVTGVVEGNDFRASFERLVKERKLLHRLDQNYLETLKDGVLYWDGNMFMSAKYLGLLH